MKCDVCELKAVSFARDKTPVYDMTHPSSDGFYDPIRFDTGKLKSGCGNHLVKSEVKEAVVLNN